MKNEKICQTQPLSESICLFCVKRESNLCEYKINSIAYISNIFFKSKTTFFFNLWLLLPKSCFLNLWLATRFCFHPVLRFQVLYCLTTCERSHIKCFYTTYKVQFYLLTNQTCLKSLKNFKISCPYIFLLHSKSLSQVNSITGLSDLNWNPNRGLF